MKKEKLPVYLLAAVLIAAAGWSAWSLLRPAETAGATATIWVDGEEYRHIDLAGAQDGDFSIEAETGKQITFRIEDGSIRFLTSDCPDKICVNTGFISADNQTAVCMPNRTSITISAD